MSEEPSGSHRLPRSDDDAPVRVPRWFLYVAISALVGGGGGSTLTAVLHSEPSSAHLELVTSLADIKSKLTRIDEKLDDSTKRLENHEQRLHDIEIKLAAGGK